MTALPTARDYSLIGRDGRLRGRERPRRRRVVPHRHPAQGDEGADAARGRPGDPRHAPLARALRRLRRPRHRALAVLVGGRCRSSAYGVLYGSAGDSRWHECGHGTAFKTRWMNDAVYQIACFMIMREPEIWRWSHTRHHTDTIIVGRDPEIARDAAAGDLGDPVNFFGDHRRTWAALGRCSATPPAASPRRRRPSSPRCEWPKVYPHRPHLAGDPPGADRARARARILAAGAAGRPAAAPCTAPGSRDPDGPDPARAASPRTCSTTG